jgi:predicted AAA+ superfamily ATPase
MKIKDIIVPEYLTPVQFKLMNVNTTILFGKRGSGKSTFVDSINDAYNNHSTDVLVFNYRPYRTNTKKGDLAHKDIDHLIMRGTKKSIIIVDEIQLLDDDKIKILYDILASVKDAQIIGTCSVGEVKNKILEQVFRDYFPELMLF